MTKAETDYITVGKIGTTYGIHGWLKIHTFMEFGASILDYTPWYLSQDNTTWQAVSIEEGRLHSNVVIVKFPQINTPETARRLTGQTIAVLRSQLPALKPNEYYWSDLVGLTVINKDGLIYGKVTSILETGSNDVLIVKNDKEHAIPYLVGTVILNVDIAKQEILVDWELI